MIVTRRYVLHGHKTDEASKKKNKNLKLLNLYYIGPSQNKNINKTNLKRSAKPRYPTKDNGLNTVKVDIKQVYRKDGVKKEERKYHRLMYIQSGEV